MVGRETRLEALATAIKIKIPLSWNPSLLGDLIFIRNKKLLFREVFCSIFLLNSVDLEGHERLTMTISLVVTRLLAITDDKNFILLSRLNDSRSNRASFNVRRTERCFLSIIMQDNRLNGDSITNLIISLNFFYRDFVALCDFVLLAPCLNDCKFHNHAIIQYFSIFCKVTVLVKQSIRAPQAFFDKTTIKLYYT